MLGADNCKMNLFQREWSFLELPYITISFQCFIVNKFDAFLL